MKNLTITRGDASYKTRGLDTILEREMQMQEECVMAIKAVMQEVDSKAQAENIAKVLMMVSASVHSDLERILRTHGKDAADVAS